MLKDVLHNSDVFIGVSGKENLLTAKMVSLMNGKPIVFALSNPDPEILPREARKGCAAVVATGRSDFPNAINNVLAFPGVLRGVLDARVKRLTDQMKLKAAETIAHLVKKPRALHLLPSVFDRKVSIEVALTIRRLT